MRTKHTLNFYLVLFIAVALCIAVLSGCSFGKDDTGDDDQSGNPTSYTIVIYDAAQNLESQRTIDYGVIDQLYFTNGIYSFDGYFTSPNGEGVRITDASGYLTESFVNDYVKSKTSVNAYPKVTERTYTLSFVSNCGTSVAAQSHSASDAYDLPTVAKAGYAFRGWSELSDDWTGLDSVYSGQLTKDTVLYAIFKPNAYSVKCYCGTSYRLNQFNYGQSYQISYDDKDGFNFKGYYTEANGGGRQLTDSEGNSLAVWDIVSEGSGLKLYAYYVSADTYTVSYPNDSLITKLVVTYKNCLGTEAAPFDKREFCSDNATIKYYEPNYTKNGYYFYGWSESESGNPKFDFSGTHTADITLYPIFKPIGDYDANKTYAYFSKADGGNISMAYGNYRYGYYVYDVDGSLDLTYSIGDDFSAEFSVYNVTAGRSLISDDDISDTALRTVQITASRGDVIKVSGKLKTNTYNKTLSYSFNGKSTLASTAKVKLPTQFSALVTYGNEFDIRVYEKTGYTFVGYYTEQNGGGVKLTDNLGKSLTVWSYQSDKTVYAYYTKNTN